MKDFSDDKTQQKYLRASAQVIATTLCLFGGKSKKLIKKWGWNVLKNADGGFSPWWILLVLWLLFLISKCGQT